MRGRIDVLHGDITTLEVEAIVNAANGTLLGGGGVDGAIHRAAGPRLREECSRLGGCATGDAKVTGGHDLPARFVIHTVGPIWRGGRRGEAEALASCYRRCFALAVEHKVASVAFPAISTGAFGYPLGQATRIAAGETRNHLECSNGPKRIVFACFSEEVKNLYVSTLEDIVNPAAAAARLALPANCEPLLDAAAGHRMRRKGGGRPEGPDRHDPFCACPRGDPQAILQGRQRNRCGRSPVTKARGRDKGRPLATISARHLAEKGQ